MVSLRDTAEVRSDSAVPFARADSVCAGASPSPDSGTADRLGGASQVRAFARSELAEMGFSSCVRVISRVVQRDTWLRVDRVTELVAWRPGEDTLDLIYVPVRYRAPIRAGLDNVPDTWIQPVITVLEAVYAFLEDPPDASAEIAVPRKRLILSFTNAAEWEEFLEPAEPPGGDDAAYASTLLATSPIGPQSLPLMNADLGWIVGQIEQRDGRMSFPAVATGLPTNLPDPGPGPPRGSACRSGEPCETILPGIPPVRVHTAFWSDADSRDVAGMSLAGRRTLAALRAADTVPYGTALPVNASYLWWWLVPGGLLLIVIVGACNAVLGPVYSALGTVRGARMRARMNRFWAKIRHAALRLPLAYRSRVAARVGQVGDHETNEACADLDRLNREVVEAARARSIQQAGEMGDRSADEWQKLADAEQTRIEQWLGSVAEWEESKAGLLARAKRVRGILEEVNEPQGTRKRFEHFDGHSKALDDARVRLDGDFDKAWRRAKEFAEEARLASKNSKRFANRLRKRRAVPESAATLASHIAEAVEARTGAVAAIRQDAKALKAHSKELSLEARRLLCRMDRKKYETVKEGLGGVASGLHARRRETEGYISRSFRSFTKVLVKFGSLSWVPWGPRWIILLVVGLVAFAISRWLGLIWAIAFIVAALAALAYLATLARRQRDNDPKELDPGTVFVCGLVVVAATIHAFALRVDDSVLNAALFGVQEDVWGLVYIGLGAMIFLASALGEGEYRIGDGIRKQLSYWVPKARRKAGADVGAEHSFFEELQFWLLCAILFYIILLVFVIFVAIPPLFDSLLPSLEVFGLLEALGSPENSITHPCIAFLFGLLLALFFLPIIFVVKNSPIDAARGDDS